MDNTDNRDIVSSSTEPVATRSASSSTGQVSALPRITQENARLFDDAVIRDFSAGWDQVQSVFVDNPRHAVELADAMVSAVVKRIADQFSQEHTKLEKQWSCGENVSAEELRQTFKRYRALSDRLLAI
jgi:hypothetical protein